MTLATIHVPVPQQDFVEPGLTMATTLGRAFGSQIVAHHIVPTPQVAVPAVYPAATGPYVADLVEQIRLANIETAKEVRAKVQEFCKKKDIAFTETESHLDELNVRFWQQEDTTYPDGYALAARVADLVVVARPDEDVTRETTVLFESLVFQSSHPVIIAPENIETPPQITAVVSWDGGKEAALAMSAAIPLLQHAKQVNILTIGNVSARLPSAADVARYLASYGIDAAVINKEFKNSDTETIIHETSQELGADLIVMGAYSHTRLREMVLGGVTRFMTRHSTIPVLLAH